MSSSLLPSVQLPQSSSQVQYDPATGAFNYPVNFTNPLDFQLSLDNLTAQVVGANNVTLGNVSITPVTIAPGATETVNVTGDLSQSAVNQLESEYQNGNLNISLANVNLDVGGVNVHIPQINNIGQLSSLSALNNTG